MVLLIDDMGKACRFLDEIVLGDLAFEATGDSVSELFAMSGLAEEAGIAYKNISDVVESVETAGITRKVAELLPMGNIKG